jgi:hypothetical protein
MLFRRRLHYQEAANFSYRRQAVSRLISVYGIQLWSTASISSSSSSSSLARQPFVSPGLPQDF